MRGLVEIGVLENGVVTGVFVPIISKLSDRLDCVLVLAVNDDVSSSVNEAVGFWPTLSFFKKRPKGSRTCFSADEYASVSDVILIPVS